MSRSVPAFAMAALLFATVPVAAQAADAAPELDRTYLELQHASRSVEKMVACLVSHQPDVARSLFDHEIGSPEYAALVDKFDTGASECLWRTFKLQTSWQIMQGAVAERLIEMDAVAGPVRPLTAPSPQGNGTYSWTWRALTPAGAAHARPLAQCLQDRHGARVAELLATRSVTRQERDVFNGMSTEITDCIPAGEKWTLQPQILRAALASAYYKAARDAAAISHGAVQ